ncbi:MAG: DsbA family protein [Solirubrobacterales bacterium]
MRADPERRQRLLQMAAGAVFLAIALVLVLIVVNSSNGSGGDTNLEEVAEVKQLLTDIPQEGMVLGDPKAPVELIEFGDLQCPVCKHYSEEILPPIIESKVKKGEVKLDFRNFTIIGEQSLPAGAAALAAGEQSRGWNYVELFYRNQGPEDSGYANDEFLEAIAKGAGVKDLAKWNQDRKKLLDQVEATTEEAKHFGFGGTPSFAIKGPSTNGLEPIGTPESQGALEEAIEKAG